MTRNRMHITARECLIVTLGVLVGLLVLWGPRTMDVEPTDVPAAYLVVLGAAVADASAEDNWVDLACIRGIGEVKARAIVDFDRSGGIRQVEDLTRIRGIGDQLAARLARNIRIEGIP